MDALELALRCSSLLMRSLTKDSKDTSMDPSMAGIEEDDSTFLSPLRLNSTDLMNESDCEKHFKGVGRFVWIILHDVCTLLFCYILM